MPNYKVVIRRQGMTQSLKMVGLVGWAMPSEQVWRKGPWTPEEDKLLTDYVSLHGEGRWSSVARCAGLNRTGKSCRLRWVNYLRPGLKRSQITPQEEGIIIELHAIWGNKWSTIARYLPGRTDNEIKNYWRTHFKKKERSTRKTSERRKSQNQKPQPQQLEATKPQLTDSTGMLTMELPSSSSEQVNQQVSQPTTQMNTKQELMFMYPNSTMEDHQNSMASASSSWMDATCMQDQDGSWWGNLWNFGDQGQGAPSTVGRVAVDQDQYCSKMALLSAQTATPINNNNNNNNTVTNNGFAWGGDPNHLYNEGYIF
ncbi:hypothetical protein Cgig2_007683 [Carnegiea gigantea]|uniref:Uncharacterized protein n=1 Tax=Carnegiea gigantea TaxID=171969 RepID=A0A9Q1K3C4_9CARY|nr:hypothetical protein Cgig2_007683 [Carnegiea gigantea]